MIKVKLSHGHGGTFEYVQFTGVWDCSLDKWDDDSSDNITIAIISWNVNL